MKFDELPKFIEQIFKRAEEEFKKLSKEEQEKYLASMPKMPRAYNCRCIFRPIIKER